MRGYLTNSFKQSNDAKQILLTAIDEDGCSALRHLQRLVKSFRNSPIYAIRYRRQNGLYKDVPLDEVTWASGKYGKFIKEGLFQSYVVNDLSLIVRPKDLNNTLDYLDAIMRLHMAYRHANGLMMHAVYPNTKSEINFDVISQFRKHHTHQGRSSMVAITDDDIFPFATNVSDTSNIQMVIIYKSTIKNLIEHQEKKRVGIII